MATKKSTKTAKTTTAPKSVAAKTSQVSAKSSPKTATKKTVAASVKKVEPQSHHETKQQVKLKKSFVKYIVLVVVIVVVGALIYFSRSLFVAAVVNGQPISRLDVVKETEKQSGKQVVDNLVRNALIEQEAKKQNVTVSEQEIDTEIKKIEDQLKKQGQNFDQVLQMQGMTKNDLRKLIKLDKLVGKIVGKDIKISDNDVNKYIEDNKEMLPKNLKDSDLKNQVRDQLKQQVLNKKVSAWLADLQKKANIQYFVQY